MSGLDEWLLWAFICFGFCAFSVAWLVSSLQSSTTFAVGAGMAAPLAILFSLALLAWLDHLVGFRAFSARYFEYVWAIVSLAVGLVCLPAGCWHFLRSIK